MSKQIKANRQVKAVAKPEIDRARKVWLAGLGAFSIAQKLGAEWFDSMAVEGKSFQVRSEKIARKVSGQVKSQVGARLQPAMQRLQSARREVEARVEQGLGRALSLAGIPSKADVDTLISRVDALSRQLRASR